MALYFESLLTEFLVVIVLLIVLLRLYFSYSFTYWNKRGVYSLQPSFPFGNLQPLFFQQKCVGESLLDIYNELRKKGVKYGGFYMFTRPILLAVDPEIIKVVTTKEFHYFHDRGIYVDEVHDPLTGHLFSIGGEKWRRLRTKLTPTFTSGKMKMMFQIMLSASEELEAVLEEPARTGEPIDIKDIFARFTTDIISSCAFGLESNSLQNPDTEFRKYGRKIFAVGFIYNIKNILRLANPRMLKFLEVKSFQNDVSKFFFDIVTQTVNYREKNNVERKDMMNLLIKLKNNETLSDDEKMLNPDTGKPLEGITMNELVAQCFGFFVAGFETSSTTMTFCLYEMSKNQNIQYKLRQEILEVLKKHGGKLSYDAITEMTYMDQVISETLRMYPPVPFLNRECIHDFKVPNSYLTIEKGTQVFISNLGLQRDAEYFPDPDKFDPERFSVENKSKIDPYAYLPFGAGPRICIAIRFGLMQTKVGLAALLKNYKFTPDPKTKLPITFDVRSLILSHASEIFLQAQRAV